VALLAVALAGAVPAGAQSERGTPRLVQGPMIGAVTPESILFWARASGPFEVEVELGVHPLLASETHVVTARARKDDDYVVRLRADGLRAGTAYFYRVRVGGEDAKYLNDLQPFRVRTAPEPGTPGRFTIAFGSCARFQEDPVQAIWRQVESSGADLVFRVGDNIYGDALDPDILAEEYRRQRNVATLEPVLRSVPQLATWDDHDYGLNNHDRTNPIRDEARAVFERYWGNPSYGLPGVPGVFFEYTYGGVDFFFLDVRTHRDPNARPDGPNKTMLGLGQLAWLRERLLESRAPFKVLVSGSGWTRAKGHGGDSWASFLHERDSLFAFIQGNGIEGVVLLSGDTHVGELNAIPWSDRGGYDFYDLVSSPLAQSTTDSWLERRPEIRIRPVHFAGPNVGLVTFDLTGEPTLTFELVGEDGRRAWSPFVLRADELRNGVVSWREKIAPKSRERMERARDGRGYYEP